MTDIVYSRCKDCNPNSVEFQCWPCSKKDDTVRKQMKQAKKERLLLSQYKLNYNFPPMPPPSQLVVNDQILVPAPAKRPRDEHTDVPDATRDVFDLNYSSQSPPPKKVVQVAVTPKKPAVKAAPLPQAAVDSPPPKKAAQVAVTPKKPAGPKPDGKVAPLVADDAGEDSSSSETCSNSESGLEDGWEDEDDSGTAVVAVSKDNKAPKMAKITVKERECVMEWLAKPRKDNKMDNGRWIRNGGGQGATMTATSGEVRTSGAYEALAA